MPRKNKRSRRGKKNNSSLSVQKNFVSRAMRLDVERGSNAPVAFGSVVRQRNDRDIVIRHSELIVDGVYAPSTGAYYPVSTTIQPGLASTFQWLSQLATLYEIYNVESMVFRYVPAVPTSTLGSFMMCLDIDALDDLPPDKTSFMMTDGAISVPVWMPCEYRVTPKQIARRKNMYVREGIVAGADLKTYDFGSFFYATQGATGDAPFNTGDIYVDYVIRFSVPQPTSGPPSMGIIGFVPTSPSTIRPFGTSFTALNNAMLGPSPVQFVVNGANMKFLQSGVFFVLVTMTGTGLSASMSASCSTTGLFANDSIANGYSINNAANTGVMGSWNVIITEGNIVTFSIAGVTTVTSLNIWITTLAPGVVGL